MRVLLVPALGTEEGNGGGHKTHDGASISWTIGRSNTQDGLSPWMRRA